MIHFSSWLICENIKLEKVSGEHGDSRILWFGFVLVFPDPSLVQKIVKAEISVNQLLL